IIYMERLIGHDNRLIGHDNRLIQAIQGKYYSQGGLNKNTLLSLVRQKGFPLRGDETRENLFDLLLRGNLQVSEKMYEYVLIHQTCQKNWKSIKKVGKLVIQSERTHINYVPCEGGLQRKICQPEADINKEDCHEAVGIYFRLWLRSEPLITSGKDQVILVFDPVLLNSVPWHINLCENNGFYMYERTGNTYRNAGYCGHRFDEDLYVMTYDHTNYELMTARDLQVAKEYGELIVQHSLSLEHLI